MKKVIKLTESDLVKIVKRVIEEQITDKGPIPAEVKKINIPGDTLNYLNNQFRLNLKKEEESKTFMDKLNNSSLDGRNIVVKEARPREESGSRTGGYNNRGGSSYNRDNYKKRDNRDRY